MASASNTIAEVSAPLIGLPAYIAGSLVAEETYGLTDAHDDVDIFAATPFTFIVVVQRLIAEGARLDDRFERVWARWLRYGFKSWHTNSIRMHWGDIKLNIVYKLVDGHPTTSLGQVLESFDFGLLAVGYDMEQNKRMDFRSALFPDDDINGPLPLMPNKRANWRNGFISQYNGLRQVGRYAKYVNYGYDLSRVKDDLVTGYYEAAAYLTQRDLPDKIQLGKIYETIAIKIEDDAIDEILAASHELINTDSLDAIMEALE